MEPMDVDGTAMAPAPRNRAEFATWGLALDDAAFARALAALGALAALAPRQLATAFVPGAGWQARKLTRLLAGAPDPDTGLLPWRRPLAAARGQTAPRLHIARPGQARVSAVPAPEAHLLATIWAALTEPDAGATPAWPGQPWLALDPDVPDDPDALPLHDWLEPWLRGPMASAMAPPPAQLAPPEMSGAEPPDESPPPAAPPPAAPRYVHADSRWVDDPAAPCAAYAVGRAVEVRVDIDARRLGSTAAPTPFPEHELPPAEQHELQVLLHEPRQFDQPMLASIVLPRTGRSTAAVFRFAPRVAGAFEARLAILHRGRVLQTLLLRTQVLATPHAAAPEGPGITLDEETQVRHDWSDLGSRRQFDLALVLNHTPAGNALATAVAGPHAWATRLDGIEQPVRAINGLISAVAHSVADYEGGLDQGENPALLTGLARVGANLYSLLYRDQLQRLASDGFDVGDPSVACIQLVSTRPDAVVPLEFMYDYDAPDPGAPLCPQHREALQQGGCPAGCARSAKPRGYVCPMGFWGLKKVIERHLFDPRAPVPAGAQLLVQVEAVEGRDRLDLTRGALLGHSQEVKPAQVKPLLARLKKKYGQPTPVAENWDDWAAAIASRQPALLLAFPHNEGAEQDVLLEIGGDKLYTLDLPSGYVHVAGSAPPLVFLLGCDVAGTAQDFSSHVRYFRQAGAAVVVSTIATVFGAHAVRVGEAIVAALLQPAARRPERIGELMRDARRDALLHSVPMALCVVAFGDADWKL